MGRAMPWVGVVVLPVARPFTMVQDQMLNNSMASRRVWLRGWESAGT